VGIYWYRKERIHSDSAFPTTHSSIRKIQLSIRHPYNLSPVQRDETGEEKLLGRLFRFHVNALFDHVAESSPVPIVYSESFTDAHAFLERGIDKELVSTEMRERIGWILETEGEHAQTVHDFRYPVLDRVVMCRWL